MKKNTLTLKGIKLSTDYELLWKLINDGHRIPAYLVYTDKYEEPIWDVVDIRMRESNNTYSIGSRGIGYESYKEGFESFKMVCEGRSLHFVLPVIKKAAKEEILAKMKSLCVPIDLDTLVSATVIPNRIAQILIEKEIYPILEDEDLKAMHLESQEQWLRILKNEEQPSFFHPEPDKRNLEHIVKWLGVTICDVYGHCMKTQNGGTEPCDCNSIDSQNKWRDNPQTEFHEQTQKMVDEIVKEESEERAHNSKLLEENGIPDKALESLLDGCCLNGKLEIVSEPTGTNNNEQCEYFQETFVDQWSVGISGDSFAGFIYGKFAENKWLKVPYYC